MHCKNVSAPGARCNVVRNCCLLPTQSTALNLVRKGGFEPPRLSAPPPQDGVSASSTTSALCELSVTRLVRARVRVHAPARHLMLSCPATDCNAKRSVRSSYRPTRKWWRFTVCCHRYLARRRCEPQRVVGAYFSRRPRRATSSTMKRTTSARCVGAPIFDERGSIEASLGLSGPVQ